MTYAGRVSAITVAGLAGRLALLGYQPIWRDEAFTALATSRPLGSMLDVVRADSAPPVAYIVERAVASLATGAVGLRLFPALAGAAAIPLGAALGRRIAGDRGGVFTAAICAVSPALALSALDARMYAVATTLVLAATLALWRAVERPTAARWAIYGALLALSLYSDYFAVLAIPAELAAVCFVLHAGWTRTLVAAAVAGAACLTLVPWLVAASAQLGHAGQPFWVQPIDFESVSGAFVQFFAGPPIEPWVPWKPAMQVFQGVAIIAGILLLGVLIAHRSSLSTTGRRAALFVTVCGIGAALLLFPLSLWHPLVDGRYGGVVWGPAYALFGAGLALLSSRRLIAAGLIAVLGATLALALIPDHPDIAPAIAALQSEVGPDDVVDAYASEYLLLLDEAPSQLVRRSLLLQASVQWYWGTAVYPPGVVTPRVPAHVVAAGGAVYAVTQPNESAPSLADGYTARARQCWLGVCVVTYRR
ncbi:MAG: glycosyltransferase family 39 protein [Candidatus Dormibacteria bacterium]